MEVQGEAASVDVDAAAGYPEVLAEIINEVAIALLWKKMPSRAFTAGEKKSMPGLKASKDRLRRAST